MIPFNFINFILDEMIKANKYLQLCNEFNNMSDNDLELIGINRYEIPMKVYSAYLKI